MNESGPELKQEWEVNSSEGTRGKALQHKTGS